MALNDSRVACNDPQRSGANEAYHDMSCHIFQLFFVFVMCRVISRIVFFVIFCPILVVFGVFEIYAFLGVLALFLVFFVLVPC